jgi:hypothetical protein
VLKGRRVKEDSIAIEMKVYKIKKMNVNPIQNSDTIRGFDENHHTCIMMSVSIYIKIIN